MEVSANSIYQADCLELLKRLNPGQVDLVYIDPPEETAEIPAESAQAGRNGPGRKLF